METKSSISNDEISPLSNTVSEVENIVITKKPGRKRGKKNSLNISTVLTKEVTHIIWLTVSECSKLCGVTTKTIRRAIQAHSIRYKIVKNRYLIDLASAVTFLYTNKKLRNKLNNYGIGQYIEKWRE
jgi:hypothetical protein